MSGDAPKPPFKLSLPWLVKIQVSLAAAIADISSRSDGTVNRRIYKLFDIKISAKGKPVKGVKTTDITIDSSRNIWFRLFSPSESGDDVKLPVILFFHGGGFAYLSTDSFAYHNVCCRIARKIPAIVVSLNYRTSPEYRFPSQYDDGFEALKFLDDRSFDAFPANADLKKCFLAGDSAGGNLAHHVAVRAGKSKFREVKVIGLIAIQPFFGGEDRTESELKLTKVPLISMKRTDWLWKAFLPEGENRDHEAVNVFGPKSEDISGLNFPATLVFVGGFDPLKDRQRRYYDGLKRAGKEAYLIEHSRGIHAFYVFPQLPEASLLMMDVKDFIQKQCLKSNEI